MFRVLLLMMLSASSFPLSAQSKTIVTGVVKNGSGEPVEGALVRVRSADKGFTFMVVTQAQGRYSSPSVLPGKYTVEAIGGDHLSNTPISVEVTAQACDGSPDSSPLASFPIMTTAWSTRRSRFS